MEKEPSPTAPSSPELEGYNSALEEVYKTRGYKCDTDSDDSDASIRSSAKGLSIIGVNPGPARSRSGSGNLLPRDGRGRFISRRRSSKSVGSEGADPEKVSDPEVLVGSLEWDPQESPLLDNTVVSENWSTTGTFDETLLNPRPLSTLPEESGSRVTSAMAGDNEEINNSNSSGGSESDKVASTLADIEEAVMIVEEDMAPYQGLELNWERLDAMVARVEELRKVLRKGHIFLIKQRAADYTTELRESVAACKKTLTDLMLHFERWLAWGGDLSKQRSSRRLESSAAATVASQAPQLKCSSERGSGL